VRVQPRVDRDVRCVRMAMLTMASNYAVADDRLRTRIYGLSGHIRSMTVWSTSRPPELVNAPRSSNS